MRKHRTETRRGPGGPLRRRLLAVAALAAPLLAACRETPTEVESGIVEYGTWPALGIQQPLPTLADLVATDRPAPEATAFVDRWQATWDHGTALGGDLRKAVYREVGALRPTIDPAAVRLASESVRGALAEVRRFGGSLPPHLATRIDDAARLLREAETAGAGQDWSAAGLIVVRAADALRETSPRSAALTLVEAAEDALGPPPSEAGAEPADLARARRLAWWSRMAIEGKRYSLAIQRGYYACLLLGVRLP